MVTLPSALVGGVLAAYFSDGIISLGSLVGFLTILGIAARNSIMLIDHFQHLERFEGEKFGPELVLRGAMERISPIMMTTLTTIVAMHAADRRRLDPGPRGRASHGDRDPGRHDHLDAAQPVRRAVAVFAVRRQPTVGVGDRDRRCATDHVFPVIEVRDHA